MKTTQFISKENATNNWYLLDAEGVPVGRLATMAAFLLRGKHRPDFTPHIDMGDHVVIINAEKVKFTGKKWETQKYYRHSGYPGGLREETATELLKKYPERIIESAVRGMLPKNRLGKKLGKKLRVYAGNTHKHDAQVPAAIEVSENKFIQAAR
ncbi:50S ribosomal protein L13 [bacterium]|nr:50S ribosomal protein L13 [candidate division CSSED10-310 bacterium]